MNNDNTLYVCSTGSNLTLVNEIIESLRANDRSVQIEVIESKVHVFKNNEIKPEILTSVRKKDVILISCLEEDINKEFVKTLFYIDALHRAGAAHIGLWQPFFFYGRQDKTGEKREPVSAALAARTYEMLGVRQFVTVHIHNEAIQGFFEHQFDNLGTQKLFWNYLKAYCIKKYGKFDPKRVSIDFPDEGAAKNARNFEKDAGAGGHAGFSKFRSVANEVESMDFFGDVKDMDCGLFDDMIDTGGTIATSAGLLKKEDADLVVAMCTHPLLNGKASKVLQESPLDRVFVTNSVHIPEEKRFEKLEIIPLGPMLAKCMIKNYFGESLRNQNWENDL